MIDFASSVMEQAERCGFKIVTAESCTAGALGNVLSQTRCAGSVLLGGFITYAKDMKANVLGVPPELLSEKTAVCKEVAEAMAIGALRKSPGNLAVAITGVAGPEPDEDGNPVGLVFCAVASDQGVFTECCRFGQLPHNEIIEKSIDCSLSLILKACERRLNSK